MPGIPPDIYNRLEEVLLDCGPFDNASKLKAMFVDSRINAWRDEIPESHNRKDRARATIEFLYNRYNPSQENALVLFLCVLRDHIAPEDVCHQQLTQLVTKIELELQKNQNGFASTNTGIGSQRLRWLLILFLIVGIVWILLNQRIIWPSMPTNKTTTLSPGGLLDSETNAFNSTSAQLTSVVQIGKIAFHSTLDGKNYDIYSIQTDDSSNSTQLTNNLANDMFVSWSPDGSQLAFSSDRFGNSEIFVMNSDGTNVTRLTNGESDSWYPSWSPDGNWIAFASNRDNNPDIYMIQVDGTNLTRLTFNEAEDRDPAWSPDGRQMAFVSNRDDDYEIYIMHIDGTELSRLTYRSGWDWHPAWSPNEARIAFMSLYEDNWEICVVEMGSSEIVRLTVNKANDEDPAWSPNGDHIVFSSNRAGNYEIYSMQANGTNPTRVTINDTADFDPEWSFVIPPTRDYFEPTRTIVPIPRQP